MRLPKVGLEVPLAAALLEMTRKGLGVDCHRRCGRQGRSGVYTDGDLRRTLDHGIDVRTARRSPRS